MPKVLFVEDELSLRMLYGDELEEHGFRTVLANNGKHALEQLTPGSSFDVIVTDLVMPEMDGFDLCRKLKEMDGKNP